MSSNAKKIAITVGAMFIIVAIVFSLVIRSQYQDPDDRAQMFSSEQEYRDMLANKKKVDTVKVAFYKNVCHIYQGMTADSKKMAKVSNNGSTSLDTTLNAMSDQATVQARHFYTWNGRMVKFHDRHETVEWSSSIMDFADVLKRANKTYRKLPDAIHSVPTVGTTEAEFNKKFKDRVMGPIQDTNKDIETTLQNVVKTVGIGDGVTRRDIMALPECRPFFVTSNDTIAKAFLDNDFNNPEQYQEDQRVQKQLRDQQADYQKRKDKAEKEQKAKRDAKAKSLFERWVDSK